jgi:hypothetical protein
MQFPHKEGDEDEKKEEDQCDQTFCENKSPNLVQKSPKMEHNKVAFLRNY